MGVLTIGEVLVEFLRKGRSIRHNKTGEYSGPFPSGAPAIFIDTAARLGLRTRIVGCIGKDDFGGLIRDRLANDRVNIKYLQTNTQRTTGIAFVTYSSKGERQFLFHLKDSAAAQVSPNMVTADLIKSYRALHITGSSLTLSESLRNACYKAVNLARRFGMIISFDPNLREELIDRKAMMKISKPILQAATIVIPSKKELFDLTGCAFVNDAFERISKHGVQCLIIKLGSGGSIALSDRDHVRGQAFRVREVDPTGAGDAFDAAVVLGYLRKWKLPALLEFANAVGALKVTKGGPMDVPMSLREVTTFIKKNKKSIRARSDLM